jgi:cbb3-type cytochrome oxidase subunit 3
MTIEQGLQAAGVLIFCLLLLAAILWVLSRTKAEPFAGDAHDEEE